MLLRSSLRLVAFLFAFLAPMTLTAQDTNPLHTASRQELDVIKVLLAQEAAWNRGDIAGFAGGYKDSPDTLFITHQISRGFAGLLDQYKRDYPTRAAMGTLSFSELEVRPLDENYAVAIGRVDARRGVVRFAANLGRHEHLHSSAVGKAMLSLLPESTVHEIAAATGLPAKTPHTIVDAAALMRDLATVRRRGYAIDDEEDNEGVFCVGAAVLDHAGNCLGAISVTGLKLDLPAWRIEQLGETVREHAVGISAELGAPAEASKASG